MALISIITVTYNAGDVIGKTMESLASQTYMDFEHIVIDGASTDKTLDIISQYSLPNTKIISEKDKGLYDAMNKGLRHSTGKYVLFLNAGDAFHAPTTLADYLEQALKNVDIIYGDTIVVNKDGVCLGPRHLSAPRKLTKNSFSNGMLICHQAFMVKKELTEEYDMNYRFSADYDWCVKCINNARPDKCINLKSVTIDYLSDGLTDKNKKASLKERFRIMKTHYGLPLTIMKHIGFALRALRRGKI